MYLLQPFNLGSECSWLSPQTLTWGKRGRRTELHTTIARDLSETCRRSGVFVFFFFFWRIVIEFSRERREDMCTALDQIHYSPKNKMKRKKQPSIMHACTGRALSSLFYLHVAKRPSLDKSHRIVITSAALQLAQINSWEKLRDCLFLLKVERSV